MGLGFRFRVQGLGFWVLGWEWEFLVIYQLSIMPKADAPGHIINFQLSIFNCEL